jgi:hypothetical protein
LATDDATDEGTEHTSENDEHRPSMNKRNQDKNEETRGTEKLSLRDWIALFIAALQTVMLPLVLLLGILFVLTIIVSIFF